MLALALGLSIAISPLPLASRERRTIERFTRGHDENSLCWDRDGADGFISPIDAHQHPMPFGGPEVPFREYTDWFIEHGRNFFHLERLNHITFAQVIELFDAHTAFEAFFDLSDIVLEAFKTRETAGVNLLAVS